eukprot:4237109-Amphidinium_carterae.1
MPSQGWLSLLRPRCTCTVIVSEQLTFFVRDPVKPNGGRQLMHIYGMSYGMHTLSRSPAPRWRLMLLGAWQKGT